jgi:acyl-ACP thioesterase
MDKFQAEYQIDSQALNTDLTVTFPRLMFYAQETSIRHTDSTHFPIQWYTDNHRGWLVIHWSVRVTRYPKLKEHIVVKTFPIRFKGAIGERGFEIYSETGAPVLMAYSAWVYTDLANQKLMRPLEAIVTEYGPIFPAPTEKKMDFPPIEDYQLASRREFTVTRRDIDSNDHVNNVKYIEWAFDDIPDGIYRKARAREVKILYKAQCRIGDTVQAEFYTRPDNLCASIFKSGQTVLAEIFSLWDGAL